MRLNSSACVLVLCIVGAVPPAGAAPVGPKAAATAPASPRVDHCIWRATPASPWIDLNQFFGATVAHVNPYGSQCLTIRSGAWWSVPMGFFVAKTWEQKPPNYNPLPTPLEELLVATSKVRMVVDEGTTHEFSVEWTNIQDSWFGDWNTFYAGTPDDHPNWLFVNMGAAGSIRPLSVGVHTVKPVWVVGRLNCDGTSADPNSCAPPGEYEFPTITFNVVARN